MTEVPQGPAVDQFNPGILSGKSSNLVGSVWESKNETPVIECMPVSTKVEVNSDLEDAHDDDDLDEMDPAFALFANCPTPSAAPTVRAEERLFGTISPEKAFCRLELVVDDEISGSGMISVADIGRFERLCLILEAASERITAMTSCF